ncbi:MAG: antibiotic biosynthesis monooxygenase [Myxococcota bacterium]
MSDERNPVTVIARHRVVPDKEDAFQAWIAGITRACEPFRGYLGTEVVRDHEEWVSIFRFDTVPHLEVWMRSEERAHWLTRVDTFGGTPPEIRYYDGIELLFPRQDAGPPPTWKMAIVTFAVIWPLVHFIPPLVGYVTDVPLLQEALGVFVVVILASYAGLPLASRLLRPWLTPSQ